MAEATVGSGSTQVGLSQPAAHDFGLIKKTDQKAI
jgi:hypothetical protein